MLTRIETCGKATTTCPENSKAGLQVMEDAVVIFEEISDKMEARDLEETLGATEAVAERQRLRSEEAGIGYIGSVEGRHMDQRRLYGSADV
jgi:hypothetical protein